MANGKNHNPWRSLRPSKARGIAGVGYVMPPQPPLRDEEYADLMARLDEINNKYDDNGVLTKDAEADGAAG